MKGTRKDPRHRAREAALQVLYQWDVGRTDVASAAETFFSLQWADDETPPADLREFASELAHDTVRRLAEIDVLIADTAERWRPERMAVIDRLVLRMATAELLRHASGQVKFHDTPPAVIINEAIELARTFSSEEAVKFINGMLDTIRRKLESGNV